MTSAFTMETMTFFFFFFNFTVVKENNRVLSLGQEDTLEKKMATHSSVLAWKSHGQRKLVGYCPWGHKESQTLLSD